MDSPPSRARWSSQPPVPSRTNDDGNVVRNARRNRKAARNSVSSLNFENGFFVASPTKFYWRRITMFEFTVGIPIGRENVLNENYIFVLYSLGYASKIASDKYVSIRFENNRSTNQLFRVIFLRKYRFSSAIYGNDRIFSQVQEKATGTCFLLSRQPKDPRFIIKVNEKKKSPPPRGAVYKLMISRSFVDKVFP